MSDEAAGTIFIAKKFRLMPTSEQEAELNKWCAAIRWIYNAALEQRTLYRPVSNKPSKDEQARIAKLPIKERDALAKEAKLLKANEKLWAEFCPFGKNHPKNINYQSQTKEFSIKALRDDPDIGWLTCVSSDSISYALMELDGAFKKFFDGGGYPTFRKFSENNSFKVKGRTKVKGEGMFRKNVGFGRSSVHLPKIGYIDYVRHTKIRGTVKEVTVVKELDEWFVIAVCKVEINTTPVERESVGIDLGINVPVALSDGTLYPQNAEIKKTTKRVAELNQKMALTQRGSNRRRKALGNLQKAHKLAARQRSAFNHQITTAITRKYSLIKIENLKVANMTKSAAGTIDEPGTNVAAKSGLNRELLNTAPYQLRLQLEYKSKRQKGVVIAVNPAYTSQTCSACGHKEPENRNRLEFNCRSCGYLDHADVNAAKNILIKE